MRIKILRTEKDYIEAVNYLEKLGDLPDFEENNELIERFDLLAELVEKYEKEHYPIKPGHPIEIIKLKMAYMDLKQKDLSPLIASKGVISEIMNKKRGMSKHVIRKFSELLKIDQSILNVDYELTKAEKKAQNKTKKNTSFKENFDFNKNYNTYISI